MNLVIVGFFLILVFAAPLHAQSHAQKEADQELVEVKIGPDGDVRVKHVIKDSKVAQQLRLVDGTRQNVSVNGESNGVSFTRDGEYVLLPPAGQDVTVEYDLVGELVEIDGVWTMEFKYDRMVAFLLPENVDLIFVNSNPVYLGEKNGIACHGCFMLLEYIVDEPRVFKGVTWEDEEFLVEIRTMANVGGFEFDQPQKSIKFDIDGGKKFVTAIIPTELLGNPYSVLLDDEKIYYHEYINNGTHVWLNAKPDSAGTVTVIGTTVIPEFSLLLPLVAGFVMAVWISRSRLASPRGGSHTNLGQAPKCGEITVSSKTRHHVRE